MQSSTVPITKGFKVTDSNMRCRGFQYEMDKEFVHKGSLLVCSSGFHFCELPADCFNYYSFTSSNRVFEIEAYGDVVKEGDKSCTKRIKFIREISWEEVLKLVNTGKDNTGINNSGNWNSGNWNSGNWNSGNWNSGDSNSGDRNSGDRNSGDRNSGDRNSGNSNSGNWNSGDRNSGNSNSGNWNSGNWNSGYRNSGDSNSGNWNSGYRNSGDSNSGYRNSGAFCTDNNPKIFLFNRQCEMTVREWENSNACQLMWSHLNPNIWVSESIMTDEEKERYPSYKTTGGYLKSIPYKEMWANMWHNLTDDGKAAFTSLPNFDAAIFEEITGIKIK